VLAPSSQQHVSTGGWMASRVDRVLSHRKASAATFCVLLLDTVATFATIHYTVPETSCLFDVRVCGYGVAVVLTVLRQGWGVDVAELELLL